MGILKVKEHWSGRVGPWKYNGVRRYARVFHVYTSSNLVGPMEVIFARDLATGRKVSQLGDFYESYRETDEGAICVSVDPKPIEDSPRKWEVTCEFESPQPGDRGAQRVGRDPFAHSNPRDGNLNRGSQDEQNPFRRAPSVRWSGAKYQKAIYKDRDDPPKPIQNAAGTPIDGGLLIDDTRRSLAIVRNEPAFNEQAMSLYHDTVNKFAFMGRDAGEVKCETIDGELVQEQQYVFWRVAYNFTAQNGLDEAWHIKPVNAGLQEKKNNRLQDIQPTPGISTSVPLPLTTGGQWVGPNASTSATNYLDFIGYRVKDFNPLRLPFPWF